MSIFKGDSIYKTGAGGGGYKDGGALVDGDFIEVKNNTVSSYDNVSRDPVNFYFEVKDGEILNSVIELTTAVNATINVYVVKNGFYYLLGNVGGNTVNAGDDYKINIIGDSFSVEQINNISNIPGYWENDGILYPLIKVGNILWMCKELEGTSFNHVIRDGIHYYEPNKNINVNGWRLPNYNDYSALKNTYTGNELKDTSGWNAGYNGNNLSGFSARPHGEYNSIQDRVEIKYASLLMYYRQDEDLVKVVRMNQDAANYVFSSLSSGYFECVRLVFDL